MYAITGRLMIFVAVIALLGASFVLPTSIADNMSQVPQHSHSKTTHLSGLACWPPQMWYGSSSSTYETCWTFTFCAVAYSYVTETCTHGIPQPKPNHSCGCPNTTINATTCSCPTGKATTCPCELSGG